MDRPPFQSAFAHVSQSVVVLERRLLAVASRRGSPRVVVVVVVVALVDPLAVALVAVWGVVVPDERHEGHAAIQLQIPPR